MYAPKTTVKIIRTEELFASIRLPISSLEKVVTRFTDN